jgi:hypothetical protein
MSNPTTQIKPTHQLDLDVCQCDWILAKIRDDRTYAQNFYAAMCDQAWYEKDAWEILRGRTWSCSWRTAGSIVADIRGEGEYTDWYCSGMMMSHPDDDLGSDQDPVTGSVREGTVTEEIQWDLAQIGWYPVVDQ